MTSSQVTQEPEPRFLQIAAELADLIAKGSFPGRLPPEAQLAERFSVSRVTLRRALGILAQEGIIRSSWGRGWYVVGEPLSEPPNALLSFTELAEKRGLTSSSKVLGVWERPASLDESEELRVAPGSRLVCIERVRLMDDVPILLQTSAFPVTRLGNPPLDLSRIDWEHTSVYRLLEEELGLVAARADYVVEAAAASEREASLLAIEAGTPVLRATQVTFDRNDVAFEKCWSAYPHDRYRFQATLLRPSVGIIGLAGLRPSAHTAEFLLATRKSEASHEIN
jgi:GntR family transcriptional regulator